MLESNLLWHTLLSNLQFELLKLFSGEVPDEDVRQIKRLITQYFAHKAIQEANQV